jgi:hypothetical protein
MAESGNLLGPKEKRWLNDLGHGISPVARRDRAWCTDAHPGVLKVCQGHPRKGRFESGAPSQYHVAALAAIPVDVDALGLSLGVIHKFDSRPL